MKDLHQIWFQMTRCCSVKWHGLSNTIHFDSLLQWMAGIAWTCTGFPRGDGSRDSRRWKLSHAGLPLICWNHSFRDHRCPEKSAVAIRANNVFKLPAAEILKMCWRVLVLFGLPRCWLSFLEHALRWNSLENSQPALFRYLWNFFH